MKARFSATSEPVLPVTSLRGSNCVLGTSGSAFASVSSCERPGVPGSPSFQFAETTFPRDGRMLDMQFEDKEASSEEGIMDSNSEGDIFFRSCCDSSA